MVLLCLKLLRGFQDLKKNLIWHTKLQNHLSIIFTMPILRSTCSNHPEWFLLFGHAMSSLVSQLLHSLTTFPPWQMSISLSWAYCLVPSEKIINYMLLLYSPRSWFFTLVKLQCSVLLCNHWQSLLYCIRYRFVLSLNTLPSSLIWHIIGNPNLWNEWRHRWILNHF